MNDIVPGYKNLKKRVRLSGPAERVTDFLSSRALAQNAPKNTSADSHSDRQTRMGNNASYEPAEVRATANPKKMLVPLPNIGFDPCHDAEENGAY